MSDAARFEAVSKRFARGAALSAVSFAVPRAAVTGLVGPDGAGKTTLLRIAAGLLARDAGEVSVLGLDPERDAQRLRAQLGYMPQRFGLYEDLSVRENLRLFADLHGLPTAEREARVAPLLRLTGLGPFPDRLAGRLSGGMNQKLGLACALIRAPAMLLLDEPTVGVDPLSRRELWRIVDQLVAEQGIGVLVATAYLDEAARCEQIVVLDQGEVLDIGRPSELATRLRGRVFEIAAQPGSLPRDLQAAVVERPGVVDATIRAGRLRVVVDPQLAEPAVAEAAGGGVAVAAELEDALIARLATRRPRPRFRAARAAGPLADEVVVRVRDLRKRFGSFEAVRGVSFEVRRGEIFGLLGPNGAGKSTTFRMLCGLSSISAGEATVAGRDLRRAGRSARARLGYRAQRFSLYPALSVVENLRFFGAAYGLRGRRLRERIAALLDEFELTEWRARAAGSLSGGFQQRLAMAAALLHEPEILFLDEPTSGADPLARREFWARITLLANRGTTIIVTTHFMEEAEYCDRILIQDAGKMLAMGTPDEVRANAGPNVSTMEDAFIAIIAKGRAGEQAG